MIPAKAYAVVAVVQLVLHQYWPGHPFPSAVPGQAEHESCRTLKSPLCMDPHVENDNPRNHHEIGVGVFQLTRTDRFDNFAAARRLAPELAGWQWADRFDLRKQVVAGVLMVKQSYGACSRLMAPGRDAYSCTLSAYNGGLGGVLADRRLCGNTLGCDPHRWDGHVALTSVKSKQPLPGYKVSAYSINRSYVSDILNNRAPKYARFF